MPLFKSNLGLQDAQDAYDREKMLMTKQAISKSTFQGTILELSRAREECERF